MWCEIWKIAFEPVVQTENHMKMKKKTSNTTDVNQTLRLLVKTKGNSFKICCLSE